MIIKIYICKLYIWFVGIGLFWISNVTNFKSMENNSNWNKFLLYL